MKRDPVLAQLDFLLNGPPKAARTEEAPSELALAPPPPPPPLLLPPPSPPPPLLAPNPVLAQLDALINGASATAMAPVGVAAEAEPEEPRGPPGILREFGGVRGWMAMRNRQEAQSTSPKRSTPTGVVDVCTNSPSLDHAILLGKR